MLILLNVSTSTVTSTNTFPSNAIVTRVDIDCTQGPDDGENYPSSTVMEIGIAGIPDLIYVAGSGGTPGPAGYQSIPLNQDLTGTASKVQVSFRGSAPAYGGCQVLVWFEVPLS